MREEYRALVSRIAQEITFKQLVTMKFLCAEFIPYTKLYLNTEEEILIEVFDFFCKLEALEKLGIDDLDWMKNMLTHLKREDLVLEVTAFQFQREVYLSSLSASEGESETRNQTTQSQQEEIQEQNQSQRSEPEVRGEQQAVLENQTDKGTILMRCAPYIAGGAWAVGSAYILNLHKKDPKALVNMVTKVVVPTGTLVRSIFPGSINVLIQATDLNSLKELWKRYQTGRLKEDLQKVLVTEELKNLANGEPIDLVVKMNEGEYRNACLDLMVAQTKAQTLCNRIISSEPVLQASRSLPDLTSLDTTHEISGGLQLVQLSHKLKRRNDKGFKETDDVLCLLQKNNLVQFAVQSLRKNLGVPHPECTLDHLHNFGRVQHKDVSDVLKEVNNILESRQIFLYPENTVKDLGSLVRRLRSKITRYVHPQSSFIYQSTSGTTLQRQQTQEQAVNNLIREMKEMAELLVKTFKLEQGLLKDFSFEHVVEPVRVKRYRFQEFSLVKESSERSKKVRLSPNVTETTPS